MTFASRQPPFNLELEQSVLGTILINNAVFGRISPLVSKDDFHEELHRRIFDLAASLIGAGQTATPATLRTYLGDQDLGGFTVSAYLARLAADAMPPLLAGDYAVEIRNLAVRRQIIAAAEELAARAYDLPVSVQPAQIAGEAITALHALASADGAKNTRREMYSSAAGLIERLQAVQDGGSNRKELITTGFADLDAATGGYQEDALWVLGARPMQGKTIYAVTSAVKTARKGFGAKVFALEVGEQQITARVLADMTYSSRQPITFKAIMDETVTPEELWRLEEARERLASMPLVIDIASRLTPAEIRIRVRTERERMAAKGVALKVVFIDYLKQVQASDRYRGNRVYEVGEISASLKQLAKDERICVVLLAQLNRALEERDSKRPSLADLRESGDLEADADVVAFIHREAVYIERSPAYRGSDPEAIRRFLDHQHKAEIVIGKNRAGPTRTVELWCDVASSTMSDHYRGAAA